ncbi:putative uncharacterized protein [Roseburia sp. CAG:309]|nr:putative uncharacterized protein [Roseburia sp. CAG:309]
MNELAQHMVDTVKEWQCKIGVRKEKMDLFYPLQSLKELLQLNPADSTEQLEKTLTEFQKEYEDLFGRLHFWKEKERYGIEIPEEGVIHIAETIPDPEFLEKFLKVIQNPVSKMEDITNCFQQFANDKGDVLHQENMVHDGLGSVFYFEKDSTERYVYCVEDDDFGLTYHRFTRKEYEELK